MPHKAHTIGDGLEDDELRDQIVRESKHQEDVLDQVDAALDQVKRNARVCSKKFHGAHLRCIFLDGVADLSAASHCASRCGLPSSQGCPGHFSPCACAHSTRPLSFNASHIVQAINATLDQQDKQVEAVTNQSQHVHDRVKYLRRQKVLRNA